jgi:hypothetical protein
VRAYNFNMSEEDLRRRRLRMILKTEMYTKNKITVIGALAVTILIYSFGIIIGD